MSQRGLTPQTSIGGHGRYAEFTTDCFHAFPYGVMRDHAFTTGGADPQLLYTLDHPLEYLCKQSCHSWTGLHLDYGDLAPDGSVRSYLKVHLRATLPAPLFIPAGSMAHRLRLHFPGATCPRQARSLHSDFQWGPDDDDSIPEGERVFLIRTNSVSFLFISSSPITRKHTVCQRHIEWTFRDASPRVMLVPIVDPADLETISPNLPHWLALVENPPIEVSETFEEDPAAGTITIHQTSSGLDQEPPLFSPIPPFFNLLREMESGAETPLVTLSGDQASIRLITTNLGPYEVVPGAEVRFRLDTRWMQARTQPTRTIADGESLAPIPDELMYAGDWTWDPDSPMDQLLSCRTWGHLVQALPEPRRSELLKILTVPTPEAFRASLMRVTEPITGLTWAKDDYLFHQKGKYVAFDTDWYNGLSLSGLQRASVSGDPALEEKARGLAAECRGERDELIAYFTIFHDWQINIASMETHFPLVNTDCAHNGLEGLLAEAKLREAEGNKEGASFVRYLAAKSAVALVAAIYLPRWIESRHPDFVKQPEAGEGWTNSPPDPRLFGSLTVAPHVGILPVTPATKNPYQFAGHFPEYTALIRAHGPVDQFREITQIWEKEFTRRYTDWIEHYTGPNWQTRFTEKHDQEARIQAPVFYALAPEVCLRLWILKEDPAEIEARFQPQPINLAEQVLLRAGYELVTTDS